MLNFYKYFNRSAGKKGFTLAEMLLALVIIGVISAIVLGPLFNKYRIMTYKNAYKKAYFNVAMAARALAYENDFNLEGLFSDSDGLKDLFKTKFRYLKDCDEKNSLGCWSEQHYTLNGKKQNNIYLVCPEKQQINSKFSSILMMDGSSLAFAYRENSSNNPNSPNSPNSPILNNPNIPDQAKEVIKEKNPNVPNINVKNYNCDENGLKNVIASIHIDINGPKGPNIYGKDIYAVYLLKDGTIKPFGYNATNDVLQTCIQSGEEGWDSDENWGHRCSLDYLLK